MIELPEIMPQRDDNLFAEILNRMRKGTVTDNDCNILLSRVIKPTDKNYPHNALHIFAENHPTDNHNNLMLQLIDKLIATLISHDHYPPHTPQHDIDQTLSKNCNELGGLDYRIDIKEGAKVMLTTNLDADDHLINAQIGKIVRVHFNSHEWEKMWIRTLRKQKGSMKDLNNHRGVFIANISSLIFEKLLKNRISPILNKNMSQFQTGGVKGKGVTDNLFILRGIVDHTKYLGKELCITFYDIEKCFDSLWLADCLNSLWENGIQNDLLYLIYLLNHRARIQVKSPLGITDTFTLTDITKQGTIMGPILNNCSLERICVEGQGYQLGSAYIKPLEYVDDIADPNNGFEEARGSNADIERIQKEKRTHFSDGKSKLLKINNTSTSKTISVNGVPLKLADRYIYLGD